MSFLQSRAQESQPGDWRFFTGPAFSLPLSGLRPTHHLGVGIFASAAYFVEKNMSLTLQAGYHYYPGISYEKGVYVGPPQIFEYRKAEGIPFSLVPVIVNFRFFPVKWLYLSAGAGITMGGARGGLQWGLGYVPAIGFSFPAGKKRFDLELRFIGTDLKVKDAHARQGGVWNGSDKATALSCFIGYFFGRG